MRNAVKTRLQRFRGKLTRGVLLSFLASGVVAGGCAEQRFLNSRLGEEERQIGIKNLKALGAYEMKQPEYRALRDELKELIDQHPRGVPMFDDLLFDIKTYFFELNRCQKAEEAMEEKVAKLKPFEQEAREFNNILWQLERLRITIGQKRGWILQYLEREAMGKKPVSPFPKKQQWRI